MKSELLMQEKLDEMDKEKGLHYWKKNAEENYKTTPISVLRYITELEQRLEASLRVITVSGWIKIKGNEGLYNDVCSDDTMIKFDNGSECRYADDWPSAIATHFKVK